MYIQLRLPSNSTIFEAISLRRPYNAFVSSRGVLMLYDSLEKWSLKKKHEQKGGSVVTNDVLTFSRRIKCTGNRFIVAVRKESYPRFSCRKKTSYRFRTLLFSWLIAHLETTVFEISIATR